MKSLLYGVVVVPVGHERIADILLNQSLMHSELGTYNYPHDVFEHFVKLMYCLHQFQFAEIVDLLVVCQKKNVHS